MLRLDHGSIATGRADGPGAALQMLALPNIFSRAVATVGA